MSDENIVIDFDQLTLGDMEELEGMVGGDVFGELARGRPSAKTLVAFVYLTKKKTDPTFTLEDARQIRAVNLSRASAPLEENAASGNGPRSVSQPG